MDFPVAHMVKKKKKICLQCRRGEFDPSIWKILWRRECQSTLGGESHGQRSVEGYGTWRPKE